MGSLLKLLDFSTLTLTHSSDGCLLGFCDAMCREMGLKLLALNESRFY